jgi:hypothetical protein
MKIHKLIQNLKERVMQHVRKSHTGPLIRSKETITKQLQNNETPLMQFLISNLNRMLSDLQKMRRPTKSTIGSGNYFRAAGSSTEIGNMVQHDET